jgi:hypothetical protein
MSELAMLREHASKGAEVIATLTGRSPRAVRLAAHRHRISLRRSAERRGKVLNEAPRVSLRRAGLGHVRDDILDGTVNASSFDSDVTVTAAARRGEQQQLCPRCAARPVEQAKTGMCTVCHLHVLAEAHRHSKAKADAQRELWKQRQRRHREITADEPPDE